MDGREVGVSVKGETSVTISGLTGDYLYSIQVIAVNTQGFQVASDAVYVRTRPSNHPSDALTTLDSPEPHLQASSMTADSPPSSHPNQKDRSSVDLVNSKNDPHSTTLDRPNAPESNEVLTRLNAKLDAIQQETTDLETQLLQATEQHAQEETLMMKKIDELRCRKKEEDDAKSLKDQHHKQLDQQRRELESRRNQVQRALKAEQDAHSKQTTDIRSFESSVKTSIDTVQHLQRSMVILKTETDHAVQDAERAGGIAAEELSEIESEIRYLLSRKTEAESDLARLLAESRVSSPTRQEILDSTLADAQWREREESLKRQFEEVQHKFLRLQSNAYTSHDANGIPPNSDFGSEHGAQMRRRTSRRARLDDPTTRTSFPAFNPDAPPFVASSQLSRTSPPPVNVGQMNSYVATEQGAFSTIHQDSAVFPGLRNGFGPSLGTTSIFKDDSSNTRNASPFAHRESPRSSQSGSNPSSPAILNRSALPSIFNAAPDIVQRHSSGSLVASLNGTPINETIETTTNGSENSKWFWPTKKTTLDPLALDRKNTRSLPKADVAPIGTKRTRSGSMHEGNQTALNSGATSGQPTSGYPDLDLLEAIGKKTSRESDLHATSALPLPRPSNGGAFGWAPLQLLSSTPRRMPNPWNTSEPESTQAVGFDPFVDLPNTNTRNSQAQVLDNEFLNPPASFHTTIDSPRLSTLNRQQSNGSRKSSKSKADSHDASPKVKKLGDARKFSSFVGRVFGKKDEREASEMEEEESFGEFGIAL